MRIGGGDDYDQLLDALDAYRKRRDDWNTRVSQNGFYDPCGYAEESAKKEIGDSVRKLDEVFVKIVRRFSPACLCPDQPLG